MIDNIQKYVIALLLFGYTKFISKSIHNYLDLKKKNNITRKEK